MTKCLEIALGEYGEKEISGSKDNPRIVEYHKATTLAADDDETPWCASFVSWCLERAGLQSSDSAAARSYLTWGKEIKDPVLGCVVVLKRDGAPWAGHVGFYINECNGLVYLLGGNQANMVNIAGFDKSRVLGYRLPA